MKGTLKTLKRAPQILGSKVGLSTKSQDAETNELVRKFAGLEDYTTKLIKDTSSFRDGVATMMSSQAGFSTAFAVIFQPILNETSLTASHPEAAETLRNIASYQELMAELRDAIQPELELIDNRITGPLKEYQELLKKIRKTITKREHKLTDYDRHNNSYQKLKDKKEKSLNDEKNLFKVEQDLQQATEEYEFHNQSLKTEIPHFLQLTTAFITPIFQTFYFVKVGILYTLLEKMQAWQGDMYGNAASTDGLEQMHAERSGDAALRLDELTITKRYAGTSRLVAQHRTDSASVHSSPSPSLGRAPSTASSITKPPPMRGGAYASTPVAEPAPPPYTVPAAGAATTPLAGKRPPPPPPAKRPGVAKEFVTALYDYAATAEGDLSFNAGDRIELVKKTDSAEDWWTGKLNGVEGVFPGNYVQS